MLNSSISSLKILQLCILAFIVGFIGDSLLQFGSSTLHLGGSTGWGLRDYFAKHGRAESVCIAGGMMIFFYLIYFYILCLPANYLYLALYGIVLDFIFRKAIIFPSLKGYYEYFDYFWSAVWGAIPLMMPLALYDLISLVKS